MDESPGWHTRGYLPHFDDGRVVQIVTFRLADSLPVAVLEKLEELALDDTKRRAKIEWYLDQGMGSSLLRDPGHAAAVCGALNERDGLDYRLHAWVIMPNHVHTLLEPLANVTLGEIVGAWKSVSARKIMRSSPGSADALAQEGMRRSQEKQATPLATRLLRPLHPRLASLPCRGRLHSPESRRRGTRRPPPSLAMEQCGTPLPHFHSYRTR
jgi:hypothetical protein